MRMQNKHKLLTALGVVVLGLVLANSLVWFFRLDISAARSYTISAVSRKLLADLPNRVEITYYVSPLLKSKDPAFQQIEDVLYEYSLASRGKVRFDVVDPKGAQETEANNLGVEPRNLSVVDQAQVSQSRVYSGIVIRYLDSYRVIPFVTSSETLEYELGVQILQMSRNRNLVLAVLNGGNGQDILGSYNLVLQELRKLYEVREVQPGGDIPLDADALFVFKAEDLDAAALVPVERFILSGKGVLIGAEPFGIILQYTFMASPARTESPLLAMLAHYGVMVGESMVLDEYNKTFPVTRQMGQVQYQEMVPYPFWINLVREDGDTGHPLTAGVESLDLLWTSPVSLAEGAEGTVVFRSTETSKLSGPQVDINPEQGQVAMAMAPGEAQARGVVVTRTGSLNSYLKTLDPSLDLPDSTDKARIIVVGDSDFASDLIQYSDSGANLQFILNALVWLGNDEDLLALRGRAPAAPRLNKIKDPVQKAMVELVSIGLNGVLIPLGIVGFGVVRLIRRRRNKKA